MGEENLHPDIKDTLETLRILSWNDLFVFSRYILGYDRLNERVHGPFCRFISRPLLDAWGIPPPPQKLYGVGESGEDFVGERLTDEPHITRGWGLRKQVLVMPRGSFKTTITSVSLPLWVLMHKPDWKIMIASLSREESTRLINIIKQHLQSNKRLSYVVGGKCYDEKKVKKGFRWAAWEVDYPLMQKPSETPSLWATSVDSYKPGRHPHIAIYDDIIDQNVVASETELQRVVEFHGFSQVPLSNPAIVYTIGTFYGEFDLYHQLLDKRFEKTIGAYVRSAYLPDGNLWWPEELNEDVLESKRAILPPWMFASQFRSIIIPQRDRTFNLDDIHFFKPEEEEPARRLMKVVCVIDPAGVRAEGSSSWAVAVIGADENQNFWDLDSIKAKATAAHITTQAIKLIKKWQVDAILVESTGFSRSYIDATLRPALVRASIKAPLIEVTPGGRSKQYRIADVENGFGAVVSNKRFYMRENNWAGKAELRSFPDATLSFDWLDAVAYAILFFEKNKFFPRTALEVASNANQDPIMRAYNLYCQQAIKRRDWLITHPTYRYFRPGIKERVWQ